MIRVLHIVSNLSVRNGVMSFIMNYYRNINKSSIQFSFMFFDERDETYEEEIKSLGGSIYKIPSPIHLAQFKKALHLFYYQHNGEFQILHIHEPFLTAFFIGFKKESSGKVIIAHAHSTRFAETKLRGIRNRIVATANILIPDYLFACSEKAGEHIFGSRFRKRGIIINNAIDCNTFFPNEYLSAQIRDELGVSSKLVIGHVGNFAKSKNHPFIIRIFKRLHDINDNAVLVLVGDGSERSLLESMCKEYAISDAVKFLGTRKNVDQIMRAFDCFFFPSVFEGLGISLIEAQATGIPCVFSNTIPQEANILSETNHIIGLNMPDELWVESIIKASKMKPTCISERIERAGFNIKSEATYLENTYLKMLNKRS